MAAVRMDVHNNFATENSMNSFLMSAKSGDQVLYAFQRVACTLAGKQLFSFKTIICLGGSNICLIFSQNFHFYARISQQRYVRPIFQYVLLNFFALM